MTAALWALSLAIGLAAQSQPTFRARVDLVEVDVVVVDKDGAPVRGLTAGDFALRDRGKPQAIATFDEMSHDRMEAPVALPPSVRRDVSNNQSAQAGRLVVMVVDDLHIYKERTDRAKEIARKVIADLGPQSSMAVLFTSGEHSTLVSEDPSVLGAAVDTLKGRQSWRRPHQAIDTQRAARIDPEMSAEAILASVGRAQQTNMQDFFDNMTQYKTLQDASRLLGGGDARRKAFVLLSEGIGKDLSGIFGAMAPPGEPPQGGTEYAAGNVAALNTLPDMSYHAVALVTMMEAMRRANVATYAIDPRGRVESKDLARECFPPPNPGRDSCAEGLSDWEGAVRQAQRGLEIMSEASGGFAVTNTDDFTGGLAKIVEDLDHYYLLGFYPSDQKGKDYRRLDLRVPGHPEWTLRFRHGYMPGGPPAPPKNSSAMVALSAGVLPKGDLSLRLTAIPLPGASSATTRLALALEVTAPVAALRDPDGKLRDTLRYEILVVDEKKARVRSLGGLAGHLTLSPAGRPEDMPASVAYQVDESLELPKGRFELRVSATSDRLGKGGSVYLDVDVPDLRDAPLSIGGLAPGYAGGARVPVAPPSVRRPAPPLPFAPTLDRVFAPADTLRVYFEAVSRAPGATASIDVLDVSGRSVLTAHPSVTAGDPLRVEDVVPLANLAPGTYTLRATLNDGSHTGRRPRLQRTVSE